jgi:hypothetical protein
MFEMGQNSTMRKDVIFNFRQILFRRSQEAGSIGQGMWNVRVEEKRVFIFEKL